MVRLGATAWRRLGKSYLGFNSSMVRLGDYIYPVTYWHIRGFQFQHGAIGSPCHLPLRKIIPVSIPAWCDWELDYIKNLFNTLPVSIPAWCDWEINNIQCPICIYNVSIPAWCDWEFLNLMTVANRKKFQFQHGAIGRLTLSSNRTLVSWFQFQHGAIGSLNPSMNTILVTMFQFQHGAIGSSSNIYKENRNMLFQFQHGAIGRRILVKLWRGKTVVSIPAWCDWEVSNMIALSNFFGFQFQHGAIGRSGVLWITSSLCSFNSSMVRLGVWYLIDYQPL